MQFLGKRCRIKNNLDAEAVSFVNDIRDFINFILEKENIFARRLEKSIPIIIINAIPTMDAMVVRQFLRSE